MIARALSAGLRPLFTDAPWAAARLAPFHGRGVWIQLAGISLPLAIDAQGFLVPSAEEADPCDIHSTDAGPTSHRSPGADSRDVDSTLRIIIPSAVLPGAIAGDPGALARIQVEGDPLLARELAFLARHLRPQWEDRLSRLLGDVAAHRIADGMRGAGAWLRDSAGRLEGALGAWITDEGRMAPSRLVQDQFCRKVDTLRDDVARLDKRVAGLLQRLRAPVR